MQPEEQPVGGTEVEQESQSQKNVNVNGRTIAVPQLAMGVVGDQRLERTYRILTRFRWSWIGRRVPKVIDRTTSYALRVVTAYQTHWEQLRDPSELDEFEVPIDEHVDHPAIWVVEFFPPSSIDSLLSAIEKNHWEGRRRILGFGADNYQLVSKSRSSEGVSWFEIASITNRRSGNILHGSQFGKLPEHFHSVTLTAIRVGSGLTAVVACFRLGNDGQKLLDQAWHSDYNAELALGKSGKYPRADAEKWVAFRKIQGVRGRLHESVRDWFSETCPGFFKLNGCPLPAMDLMLLEKCDLANQITPPTPEMQDSLRALGISTRTSVTTAEELSGLILDRVDPEMCPTLDSGTAWTLIGRRSSVLENSKINDYYSGNIAAYVDRRIRGFIVKLAITDFLLAEERAIGSHRDVAKSNYRRHKMKYIDQLHDNLVTHSLDVKSAAQSIADFNRVGKQIEGVPQFMTGLTPWVVMRDKERGFDEPDEPVDSNELLRSRQADLMDAIKEADDDFRGVLSSAASLSASIQSSKIARVARTVSLASLAVSVTTFLLTDVGNNPKWHSILHWLTHLG